MLRILIPLCRREGVTIAWGNPSEPATFPAGKFDIVYDNNGKDMDACKPLIDTYKVRLVRTVVALESKRGGARKEGGFLPCPLMTRASR